MTSIYAPFTEEQVKSINGFQNSTTWHPFTCECGDHIALVAKKEGMICPACGCIQNWVHDFMADLSWKMVDEMTYHKRYERESKVISHRKGDNVK